MRYTAYTYTYVQYMYAVEYTCTVYNSTAQINVHDVVVCACVCCMYMHCTVCTVLCTVLYIQYVRFIQYSVQCTVQYLQTTVLYYTVRSTNCNEMYCNFLFVHTDRVDTAWHPCNLVG